MNDSEPLPIIIENSFEELPKQLSVSFDRIDLDRLVSFKDLFDMQTPRGDCSLFKTFNPLIIYAETENLFTIIDGCKRYIYAKNNNQKSVPCLVINTPCNTAIKGLLRIALNLGRPLHVREKYLFITWLKKQCTEDSFNHTAQKAGFSPKDVTRMTSLLDLEPSAREAIFEGNLDLSLLEHFLVFTAEDQKRFLETFNDLKLSLQTQREFLEWLPEIAYTPKKTISDILSEPLMKDVLDSSVLNGPQKIQKIHAFLCIKKFPALSEARSIWDKQAAACNPDPELVSFTPHPYFEKNNLDISISITSAQQAVDIIQKLSMVSLEEWQKLIYPLQKK